MTGNSRSVIYLQRYQAFNYSGYKRISIIYFVYDKMTWDIRRCVGLYKDFEFLARLVFGDIIPTPTRRNQVEKFEIDNLTENQNGYFLTTTAEHRCYCTKYVHEMF